ncbi:MAG: hypothetical protein Q9213_005456 [Squamulea squamosa]
MSQQPNTFEAVHATILLKHPVPFAKSSTTIHKRPKPLQFSDVREDGSIMPASFNDETALAKRLGEMEIGKPATYGGLLRDPEGLGNKIFSSFNTHTLPDVTGNTRIIGVLGITDAEADPAVGGWFLSDFFVFWNLMHGCTKIQHWYHCLDLDALVQKHTRYLHGNPYKQRKVVLDDKILQRAKNSGYRPQRIDPGNLRSRVQTIIKSECVAAEKLNENVLVLMFAHGTDTNAIELGGTKIKFELKNMKFALKGLKTPVTLITTQCYGGGWACTPMLNISAMTAAGAKDTSRSWRQSGSCGRYCGSMFVTALVDKLIEDLKTGKPLMDVEDGEDGSVAKPPTQEQWETYSELCYTVFKSVLEDVDRRGYKHEFSFSAQDDAWDMCWRERTGIPLWKYKETWDRLDNWEADQTLHRGDPLNRDPRVTDEERKEYATLRDEYLANDPNFKGKAKAGSIEATGSVLGKRKTSGLYGGGMSSLLAMIKKCGVEYLRTYPGHDDTGDDGALHGHIRWILADRPVTIEVAERTLRQIQYRMEQQAMADRYLEVMDLAPPLGQPCSDFDIRLVRKNVDSKMYNGLKEMIEARPILFPWPNLQDQGRPFNKGRDYLIAAFAKANTLPKEAIQKLDGLVAAVHQGLELSREFHKQIPEVASKRQKFFHSWGIRGGNMSPAKRWSLSGH